MKNYLMENSKYTSSSCYDIWSILFTTAVRLWWILFLPRNTHKTWMTAADLWSSREKVWRQLQQSNLQIFFTLVEN